MLRSQPQRWIPELRFGYPPLRNFPKSFWEKLGIFLESLGGSQRQLWIKTRPLEYPGTTFEQKKSLQASSETKGPGEEGAARYCPKILHPKRAKMVLCSFHRSHREIRTRNRPFSETKFLGAPSSPGPFVSLLIKGAQTMKCTFGEKEKSIACWGS